MTEFEFVCTKCDALHRGLPALAFDGPAVDVAPKELKRRVRRGEDTYILDGEHHFVRTRLEIPIIGTDQKLEWGVWGSLSKSGFARYLELAGKKRRGPERFFSWFASHLPLYPDTVSLKTMIQIEPYPMRPIVELEPTEHPLAVDQRNGIDFARVRDFVEFALHGGAIQ